MFYDATCIIYLVFSVHWSVLEVTYFVPLIYFMHLWVTVSHFWGWVKLWLSNVLYHLMGQILLLCSCFSNCISFLRTVILSKQLQLPYKLLKSLRHFSRALNMSVSVYIHTYMYVYMQKLSCISETFSEISYFLHYTLKFFPINHF